MTSSKINKAPYFLVIDESSCKYPARGKTKPAFAGYDSTMIAAMSSPHAAKSFSSASGSLYGSTKVFDATARGTPAESGSPCVKAPEPAATNNESLWP